MTTLPTQKQLDHILRLHNKVTGERNSYLSQTPYKKVRTQEAASLVIDDLTAQLTARDEGAAAVDLTAGADRAPSAEELLALLGRRITVRTVSDHAGVLTAVVPSPKDGTPALRLVDGDAEFVPRLSAVKWFRLESGQ